MSLFQVKRFLVLTTILLVSFSINAGPISNLILDLNGTIVQTEQDYKYENGKQVPLLEEISGIWADGSGKKRAFKYYLKAHARELIESALALQASGHLYNGVSFLTHEPQLKLNAVLSSIVIGGKPLIDLVQAAYGTEAIAKYSKMMRPDETSNRGKKDLGIFTNGKNIAVWEKLKEGDVTAVNDLAPGKISGTMTGLMVDDSPGEVVDKQAENVVKIKKLFKRDDRFRSQYQSYSEHPMASVQHGFESQSFLSLVDAERNQLKVLTWLLKDTKRLSTPNPYHEWSALLTSTRTLGLDYAHFNYLIPDLMMKDSANQDTLILGRDCELFFSALMQVKDKLGMKSRPFYLEISRLVAKNEAHRLPQLLRAAGIDVDAILSGKRKLLIVDSNHNGSIPKAILTSLVPLNDPNWRTKVKNIRSYLFNPARTNTNPPEAFSSYEEYLANGAFLDRSIHQDRVGYDFLRMTTHYMDGARPKLHIRSIDADANGNINVQDSPPSSYRYALVLNNEIKDYYGKTDTEQLLKSRINFLKGIPGQYPSTWSHMEPMDLPHPPIVKLADFRDVKMVEKARHRPLAQNADIVFDNIGNDAPDYVPHHRLPGREKDMSWSMYAPQFAKGEVPDLSKSHLQIPTIKPIHDMTSWPKLSLTNYREIRSNGVVAMSRTARGEQGNAGKTMTTDSAGMARATIGANATIGETLFENRNTKFETPAELESFIINKINIPYIQEIRKLNGEKDVWRTWAFQNEDQKASGDFFARHSPLKIERDWAWFVDWLHKNMQQDYDPIELSARVHYYLSNWIHPFADGVGKTTRDIMDFLFIRKGYMPVDWTRIDFQTYWDASSSKEEMRDTLLQILKSHKDGKPMPALRNSKPAVSSPKVNSCAAFYGA